MIEPRFRHLGEDQEPQGARLIVIGHRKVLLVGLQDRQGDRTVGIALLVTHRVKDVAPVGHDVRHDVIGTGCETLVVPLNNGCRRSSRDPGAIVASDTPSLSRRLHCSPKQMPTNSSATGKDPFDDPAEVDEECP